MLGSFQRRYPQIELIVTTGSTEDLMRGVQQQTLDLVVVMQPATASTAIVLLPMLCEELVFVVQANHPLATKNCLEPRDVSDIPFISFFRGSAMQLPIDRQ